MADYTAEHARAGIQTKLPKLDTWPNQYPSYVITTRFPEYTSVCPKTGLPESFDELSSVSSCGLPAIEAALRFRLFVQRRRCRSMALHGL